ncbi:MAG TPA: tryptophan 2,3-dioxygenase family protein [Ignavibacteria bacterium]|nr:tryptophan 2,3-dioxygenase family protein [Ignavibacteria bacterium]
MKYPPIYYADYLDLDKLLNSQHLKSVEYGKPAHDEMLFIIVHQAYELWFKQIIFELNSVIDMFDDDKVDERNIGTAISRLNRITEIQRILIDQLRVLETMTPLDFLDFRDFLVPASGFQSVQFRTIENKLGLRTDMRVTFGTKNYHELVSDEHQKELISSEKTTSLLEIVNRWLERTPFLSVEGFNFKEQYGKAVTEMLDWEREVIESNPEFTDEKREKQFVAHEGMRESFAPIFDEAKYNKLVEEGHKKFSYRATLAALFINLYRDEPILHMPYRFLTLLVDIDENFTSWRYKHALMVHRMIGAKIGTGGSSGHGYLLKTAEKHKVFRDLFDMTTFMIPRSSLPVLPENLKRELGFYYTYNKGAEK